MSVTGMTAAANAAEVGVSIPVTLRYTIKPAAFEEMTSIKLAISHNSTLHLDDDSVMLNGNNVTNYTYSGNMLSIPITSASGVLTFSVTPVETGKVALYAQMSYTTGSTQKIETVGSLYLDSQNAMTGGYQAHYLGSDASSVMVMVSNASEMEETVRLGLAVYDNAGGLIGAHLSTATMTAGSSATVSVDFSGNADTVKVFVMDPTTLAPLCPRTTFIVE